MQKTSSPNPDRVALRPPAQVMRLSRLGSFHQSRLSFMRILMRRMVAENWQFSRPVFEVDDSGVGHAVYAVDTADRRYALVAFAHDLPDDQRSDRVIAEAWDTTYALFDGMPTQADIDRLRANVPMQEAGRVSERELTLSRANRSVRLWDHVVGALSQGQQPDAGMLQQVGYLMRTTAVYGSGKFGAADRAVIEDRPECAAPFQVEMLTVYLIRTFVRDLVNHMARVKGGAQAVELAPELARGLGIGNSTGLGMAPFLINHPQLLHNWIAARETALSRVRGVKEVQPTHVAIFRDLLHRSQRSADLWLSEHPIQKPKVAALRDDLNRLAAHCAEFDWHAPSPWDRLFQWSETRLGEDAQEALVSLMLEPYPDLVDDLAPAMSDFAPGWQRIDGAQTVDAVRHAIQSTYAWVLDTAWSDRAARARAWYTSAEKLEPRLGERFDEPIEDYEQPLAPGYDVWRLWQALQDQAGDTTVAALLMAQPDHRQAVRRVQTALRAPYAEIRDNTISADLMPIDMLRCKLSFFGATHFDPRSDRWVRICLFGHAPYPEDLAEAADDWIYPPLAEAGA